MTAQPSTRSFLHVYETKKILRRESIYSQELCS